MHCRPTVALCLAAIPLACGQAVARAPSPPTHTVAHGDVQRASVPSAAASAPRADTGTRPPARAPNELGRIPIFEYHLLGETERRWSVTPAHFRHDLELLYAKGYRPVTIADLVDRTLDLPAGLSPVVVTFDDAPPSQFRYLERDGRLTIDSTSAVGIWLAFHATHPDWANSAVFCLLPAAKAGHAFFGDKNIDGQKTAWRYRKVRFLAQHGFELCDHTLWHANLGAYPDSVVQEQIARGLMAIDSAVPGYRVRTFALPLGVWPRHRALARAGHWRDPTTHRVVHYAFDAILRVAGGAARSPYDPQFDALRLPRIEVYADAVERTLAQLDRRGIRYVSDGDPHTVARPRDVAVRHAARASATARRHERER